MTTDPVTLAREVLAAEKVMDGTPGLLYLDGPTHEHEEAASATLDAAPALAHAVIRLADLADDLDEDAVYVRNAFNGIEGRRRAEERRSAAARIRAALNGENHD